MPDASEVPLDSLTAMAAARPDKTAIIDDRPGEPVRSLTYREFNGYVNRLANGLLSLGIEPGDRIMWLGRNSIEVAAFSHAARKTGTVSVPLNYRLTDDESVYVIDDSDSVLVFADAPYAAMLDRIRSRIPSVNDIVVFSGDGPAASAPAGPGPTPYPGQIAESDLLGSAEEPPPTPRAGKVMIYTSGTTGNPKGAVRSAALGSDQSAALLQMLSYRPDDVHVTCGPLYHSGPGAFASLGFLMGHTVVVQHKFDPEDWLRLVDTYRATTSFSAPTPIRMIANLPSAVKERYDASSMRVMVANAAPWPFALKEAYVKDFPPESLWEIYGSTELGVNTVLTPEDQLRKPGSCGRPAPLVEIALFDDDRNLIRESNVPGEVFIRASSVFETYHKAHDRYEADDHNGWHTVGDIAYRDDEGFYYICDRKKDMIISGGMNIYPAEIEAALEQHSLIYEVAVIGVPSDEWGESVMAVVVPKTVDSTTPLTEDDVVGFARSQLAGYKVPRLIEFVDEIPKTGSNKMLKRELRERFAAVDG